MLHNLNTRDLDWFFRPTFEGKVARYPLTNLGYDENKVLYIEVAVAGFGKDDIELEQKGNQLHISGKMPEVDENVTYIQQHISASDFERIVVLHENYVGGDIQANVINGVLTITVRPKEQAKRLISIAG